MGLVVRPPHEHELAAVGELTFTAYAAEGHIDEDDDYARVLRDAGGRARQAELYVAVEGETLLGTVTFCPEGSAYRELAAPGEAEFRMLAVAPQVQGRGVGEALVRVCLERATELGYAALVLCSLADQHRAHRLYRRLGFRRTPALDWHPRPEITLVAFRRDLGG